ncbi:hypothetical protein DFH27DRAFT_624141 [Peziza echinospora]|nr:hypothetical protein DFH27DRAFT_624141 [Peziza echinospora]
MVIPGRSDSGSLVPRDSGDGAFDGDLHDDSEDDVDSDNGGYVAGESNDAPAEEWEFDGDFEEHEGFALDMSDATEVVSLAELNERWHEVDDDSTKHEIRIYKQNLAMQILHGKIGIDWSNEKRVPVSELKSANKAHRGSETPPTRMPEVIPTRSLHLDYTAIVAAPYKPLVARGGTRLFTGHTFYPSLWATPYRCSHAYNLDFSLKGRTFFFGKSCDRIKCYLVLAPRFPTSGQNNNTADIDLMENAQEQSHVPKDIALQIWDYIKEVFLSPGLAGCGLRQTATMGNSGGIILDHTKWCLFQKTFMDGWPARFEVNPDSGMPATWFDRVRPHFHCYDYGQDIELIDGESTTLIDFLAQELDSLYDLSNAWSFSCAVANNVTYHDPEYVSPVNPDESSASNTDDKLALGILADRNTITELWERRSDQKKVTFYPLAWQQRYGNFQAAAPPDLFKAVYTDLNNELRASNRTVGNGNVVNYGPFQGYNLIKQLIRHDAQSFELKKGNFTGSMCFDRRGAKRKQNTRHDKLCSKIDGSDGARLNPISLATSETFDAIQTNKTGFRLEFIVNVNIHNLLSENRNFEYVCNEVLQPLFIFWARLDGGFEIYKKLETWSPGIFPGILTTYGGILEAAMDYYICKYKQDGVLNVVDGEGVAALERLGTLMWTGDPRVVLTKLWSYLGMSDGIKCRGMPFFNPDKISLTECTRLPRDWPINPKTRLPFLNQLKAIEHHYGAEKAKARAFEGILSMVGGGVSSTRTLRGLHDAITNIIQCFMIPELQA